MREADVQLRYDPILRFLDAKPGAVLEVGGGVAGIAQFRSRKVTVCDPYYLRKKGARADWRGQQPLPNIVPVGGTATRIPFPNNAFPFVVSSDMLEHLPKRERPKAIREMLRVSRKYVLVNFPCGAGSAAWERRLFQLGKSVLGKEHRWLKEHLQYGLPTESEVIKFLNGLRFQRIGTINRGVWVLYTILGAVWKPLGWLCYPLAKIPLPPYYRTLLIIEK